MRARTGILAVLLLFSAAAGLLSWSGLDRPTGAQEPPAACPFREGSETAPTCPPLPTAPPACPVFVPPGATRPCPPILPPPLPPNTPVRLDRMTLGVVISDGVARTTADLIFTNPRDRPQESTILFPLPAGVAISDFSMSVDGRTLEGEILGKDEAARIYTAIVQRQRDPALLEYAGLDAVRARVFPVPPHGESRLTLRYTGPLAVSNNTLRYRQPLGVGADTRPTLSSLEINVRVSDSRGVAALFSPSHTLTTERQGETAMTGHALSRNTPLTGGFDLNVLPAASQLPAGLISYRSPGADGFFMLWLAPLLRPEAVVEKDVLVVLDTSGSMSGRKIDQAKAAVRFVLGHLNLGDRFNVIPFSSSVDRYAPSLRPASESTAALRFVDSLQAEGGTNINDALLSALSQTDATRPTTVLFLTDGLPTNGVTDRGRILDNVHSAAPANSRIFAFGLGDDVDTTLLDSLASQNRGDAAYVPPAGDVEEKVSTLYARISSPQLTSLRLDFGDALVTDLYPQPLPDLFGGQTIFVFGRYRTPGPLTMTLSGDSRDGRQRFSFDSLSLTTDDRAASYLPYLWASRKVGTLLREIRLRGPAQSKELIDEVVTLSTRYGIITPYTSFLVQEPRAVSPQAAATAVARAAAAPVTGAGATSAAAQTGALVDATPGVLPPPTTAPSGTGQTIGTLEQRFVGEKSFVLRAGVWTDTSAQPGVETFKVVFGSDDYFALVLQKPELAPFFALGERVIVALDDDLYEVTSG